MLRVTSKLQDRVQERCWIQSYQKKGSNQKLEWDRQQIADTAIAKWYLANSPGAIYLRGRSHLPRHPLSYSINSPNTGSLSSWVCFCYGISSGNDKTEANCFIAGVLRYKIPWTKGNQTLQQLTPNTTKTLQYSPHWHAWGTWRSCYWCSDLLLQQAWFYFQERPQYPNIIPHVHQRRHE